MRANRKIDNKSKTNNDINNETENQAIWKLEIKKDSVTKEKEKKNKRFYSIRSVHVLSLNNKLYDLFMPNFDSENPDHNTSHPKS